METGGIPQGGAKYVGIQAVQVYVPRLCVQMQELERFDAASSGKYVTGLGQESMHFCDDNEDVHSLSLTVVSQLLERYGIDPKMVGRVEVGTESAVDRSKSVKSVIMSLFEASGNGEVDGLDCTNACYGGTAALFNTVAWMESSLWDGRLGIVVCADIATYAPGPARCTGGAGAVALLIAPNAALVLEPALRSTWMGHSYDFYKPVGDTSEYPILFGEETLSCFFNALDTCYGRFRQRAEKFLGRPFDVGSDVDFLLFHAPFNKLVRKSVARLAFLEDNGSLAEHAGTNKECWDRATQHKYLESTKTMYEQKVHAGAWVAKRIGNCYTASLYISLAAALESQRAVPGCRILLYSFGSGFASCMYSLKIRSALMRPQRDHGEPSLQALLEKRVVCSPEQFTKAMQRREQAWRERPYHPVSGLAEPVESTFYLEAVDEFGRRSYRQR
ncbi:Hydroxymethylglutaryl-CoA synthase A [Porphyridium purpureum]|uniref:Hydroxymethylglutaryl-CoA synthase n=1 Tax=Porphyridium purpureum TaxID=35688 RepID=A0A5J4YS14_PORPP|nr:Hydroxymethylglutaryl-CoA synthase A [Porphyridium purpureum]|eukprot:POR9344..scf236_6